MRRTIIAGATALVLLTCGPPIARSQEQQPGWRAYVDPQTGKLATPPSEESAASSGSAAAEEPLVVEPGPSEAGGVMVDLRGRLTYSLEATIGPDGKIVTHCIEKRGEP